MSLADLMGEEFSDEEDSDSNDDPSFTPSMGDDVRHRAAAFTSPEGGVSYGVPYGMYDDDDEFDDEDGEYGYYAEQGPSDEIRFSHEQYFTERVVELLSGSMRGGDPASLTGLLTGVKPMLLHQSQSPHPERPARLVAILDEITRQGLDARCRLVPARSVALEDARLVHSPEHVAKATGKYRSEADALAALGLDSDTYFAPDDSGYASMLSAGSVVEMATRVVHGELRNALATVRPPGHHCECAQSMGFCLLNNVCVAAAVAKQRLGITRVMILDWDVHHGNGVQHIHDDDPNVLYVSLHRYGHGFYPATGHPREVGAGAGEGSNVNVAWSGVRFGDKEYVAAFERVVMPIAREFQPELVLVSAGFDAAAGDPLGEMELSPAGYAHMTALLSTLANGKLVVALEGGYNLRAIRASAAATLRTLLGEPPPMIARGAAKPEALADIERVVRHLSPYWACLRPPESPERAVRSGASRETDQQSLVAMKAQLRRMKKRMRGGPWFRGPRWWYKYA